MRLPGNKILAALGVRLKSARAHGAVELGIDVLEGNGHALLNGKRAMFFKCYDRAAIAEQLVRENGPRASVTGWADNTVRFKGERSQYLLY